MSADDILWAAATLGGVVVAGYVAYELLHKDDATKQPTYVSLVPSGIQAAANGTVQGSTRGYNYEISPSSWSTDTSSVLNLAEVTQGVISSGIGGFLAPVLAPVNALGGYLGGLL